MFPVRAANRAISPVLWRDPDLGNVGRIMALLWRVQPDLPVKIRP
jgi:hypothetical protein